MLHITMIMDGQVCLLIPEYIKVDFSKLLNDLHSIVKKKKKKKDLD